MPRPNDKEDFGFRESEQVVIYKLGKIEATLEEIKINQLSTAAAATLFQTATNKRLDSLEKTRDWAIGVVGAISFLITIVGNFIYKMIVGVGH